MAHTELAKRTVLSDFPPAFFRLWIEQFLGGALYGSLCFCHNQTKGFILNRHFNLYFYKRRHLLKTCFVGTVSYMSTELPLIDNGSTGWLDTKDHSSVTNASHPWSLLLMQLGRSGAGNSTTMRMQLNVMVMTITINFIHVNLSKCAILIHDNDNDTYI